MDPYTNEDSTSNQSDSSSSSTNRHHRIPTDSDTTGSIKRTLITKNAGLTEKRKRNISGSALPIIKRELPTGLNDEVCERNIFRL